VDVSYIIDGAGHVYQGRPEGTWGAHTTNGNCGNRGIAVIAVPRNEVDDLEMQTQSAAMSDPVYMDAEIRPNRSLSERGFIVLIAVVTAANCASAAVFVAMGATFVPIFLGADLLAGRGQAGAP